MDISNLSKHQKRNIRAMAKKLADEVVLVSKLVHAGSIDPYTAEQRLGRVCRKMVARDGLKTAVVALQYFRGMVDANAPDGTLNGIHLIVAPIDNYFDKFQIDMSKVPKIHIEKAKEKKASDIRRVR